MEDLSQEVEAAMRMLQERVKNPDDTGLDPAELEQEIKDLQSFNEVYRTRFDPTPPQPPKKIDFHGRQVSVHRVNNHPMLFEAAAAVRSGKKPENALEVAYGHDPGIDHYPEIFDIFQQKYPTLYNKMIEITSRMRATNATWQSEAERKAVITKEEQAERDFYPSVSYVAMASIARQIDPQYSLDRLY